MKRIHSLLALCLLTWTAVAAPKSRPTPKPVLPALIPAPQRVEVTGPYKVPLLNVRVEIDPTLELPAEGYVLETYRRGVRIRARDERGAIWARRTLRQLADERGELVPSVRIVDWPAFAWRGFMHDTGRNFIPVDSLKRHLDLLSQYKINLFHWHLTDYPAWRIESQAFPQLNDPLYQRPGRDVGRFYTYGEIRDVIAYARRRGILVVPEIDMPGHSAYFNSAFGFGMADPRGMAILERALNEFFAEIPASDAPYIHIGSDEVRIPNSAEFMRWADSVVRAAGRVPMVWDPGLPAATGTIRQVWSEAPGYVAANAEGRGPFVDSYMGYLNNYDPISFTPRMLLHAPCDREAGDSLALGGILCLWNDTKAPGVEGIVRNSGLWSGLLPFAERLWHGGAVPEGAPRSPNLFPDPASPAGEALREFEGRMEAHKRGLLAAGEPFAWWPNGSLVWRVSEPVPFGADTTGLKWRAAFGGAIDVDALLAMWGVARPDSAEVWAETTITVPRDTILRAQVGFEAPSRSNRISSGIGRRGEWESEGEVWVNGARIAPPDWDEPGAYAFRFNTWARPEEELPYTSEQLFWTRLPVELPLRSGPNRIVVRSRKLFPAQHWIFALIPHE